jgi:hypothetical protein
MYQNKTYSKKGEMKGVLTREVSGKLLVKKESSIQRNDRENRKIVRVHTYTMSSQKVPEWWYCTVMEVHTAALI